MTTPTTHPLVAAGRVIIVPGVYDVLSARIAHQAGFHSAVLTGYGVAASHLGRPDVGLLTQTEILDVARRILANVDLRLVVDGDTGFGGPLNVERMVRELVTMGARGVLLEDQQWPKRCGHMRGKRVVDDPAEHVEKIRAAVEARGDAALFITARTDAIATHGLDEAIRRAILYKEAGADILFIEGPRSVDELRRIGAALPPPLAVNLIEGGTTPLCSIEELVEMGFISVGFVLSGLYATTRALQRTYSEILARGTTAALGDHMLDFSEFNETIGVDEHLERIARFEVRKT
jgi:2-methylisocitrate lyase-like PEP mutase family enzyme